MGFKFLGGWRLNDGGGGFNPASLFAAGEQGVWYDPSDFSTMFQDDAGTIPVTATGQAVGRILDKSGRGNHATQSNGSFKPVLQQDGGGRYYLAFDGLDDYLATTGNVDLSATSAVTLFSGVNRNSNAVGVIMELGTSSSVQNGAFGLFGKWTSGTNEFGWRARGTTTLDLADPSTSTSAAKAVLTTQAVITAPSSMLRKNGAQIASSTSTMGTGPFGTYVLYIGRRAGSSLPFSGGMYPQIVRGAATDASTVAAAEAWVNSKTGAY